MPDLADSSPPASEHLVAQLRTAFSRSGAACARIDDLDIPAAEWRRAAGAAGAEVGRPVYATAVGGAVYAVVKDWPANEEEEVLDHAAINDR